MGRRVDPAFGATWRRTPGRQVASIVRWWFGAMLWGGFALQVLAGGHVFAFAAYVLLSVLGWS
ncbi:MAG: hypothetical protein AB7P33_03650 [Dehalococcoidia bacterium]